MRERVRERERVCMCVCVVVCMHVHACVKVRGKGIYSKGNVQLINLQNLNNSNTSDNKGKGMTFGKCGLGHKHHKYGHFSISGKGVERAY